jgi:hypothetical protein
MMTWNYRIVRYKDGSGFGLHEVQYDETGKAKSMTAEPCVFACDLEEGPDGIRASLGMAMKDASTREIFIEPETWD